VGFGGSGSQPPTHRVEVELGQTGPGRAHHFTRDHHFIPFLFLSLLFSYFFCHKLQLEVFVYAPSCGSLSILFFFIQPFLFISIHAYIDYVCKLCAEVL
jgi:hypothetical protein